MRNEAVNGRGALLALLTFFTTCAFSADRSTDAGDLPSVGPVMACASLAHTNLSTAVNAPVTLSTAVEVDDGHKYCRVTGTIARANHFEVRLPTVGWSQRFLQTGCGGLCGMLRIDPDKAEGCKPVADGTIALASTDMGHGGRDDKWGDNPDQRTDFAWRGVHLTALASKALIKAFYGQAPRYSYFTGCSDGGREALMEAQRFPEDFDGIGAGAPALNFTVQNSFHHAWLAKANTGTDGKPLLTAVDMIPLHAAVMKACDGLDGLVDGQITDPRLCHVDPAVIQCKGAYQAGQCLTSEQVIAVRRIYDGARAASGIRLEVGPLMPGSELEWIGVFVPRTATGPIGSANMALDTINHLLFTPNLAYTIANFPFTVEEFAKEDEARKLYSADNANLKRFQEHGGKLILWHGWADPHISPLNTIDYYERVGRALGKDQRDQFVRLFLFPGMGHCSGGDGPSEFPLLSSLMNWVEHRSAPQTLIAHRPVFSGFGPPHERNAGPPSAAGHDGRDGGGPPPEILAEMQRHAAEMAKLGPRSRPVYAYPGVATYKGSGAVDDAKNFQLSQPSVTSGIAEWVGSQ